MRWRLTPDRFLALWTATGLDEIPFPLRYRSTALWEDEHAANLEAAHRWRRANPDERLTAAIATMRYAEVAVEVYGQFSEGSELRLRGCIRHDSAVLARQDPGRAGDLVVTATAAHTLVEAVVQCLPGAPPGTAPALSAPTAEVAEFARPTQVLRTAQAPPAVRLRRLLTDPRSGTGSVRVLCSPDGLNFTPVTDLGWFDVAGDGRYLFRTGHHTHVCPATPELLRDELAYAVDEAREKRGRVGAAGLRWVHG